MFRISCFGDEISPDLHRQIEVIRKNNIGYIELRSVSDKNVLDLSDAELANTRKLLADNGIRVSSIGSPIGKVDINSDFGKHLDRFKRAVETALKMESRYIRIFSFYIGRQEADRCEDTVVERLGRMIDIAKANKIILLHENEAGIFGETSSRCLRLFKILGSEYFKAVFDPCNFVIAGEDVFDESFKRLKPYIEYLHIKDAKKDTGEIVAAGYGDGHIREVLSELKDAGNMFVSLEPHLSYAGASKGFTGPELFGKANTALRHILDELQSEYI